MGLLSFFKSLTEDDEEDDESEPNENDLVTLFHIGSEDGCERIGNISWKGVIDINNELIKLYKCIDDLKKELQELSR